MLTVVIKDSGEKKVTDFTYELLWKELKDIPGSHLFVSEDWFDGMADRTNKYICFVEADCLVSSGYFASMLGLLKKDPFNRKLAMMSSTTGVNNWANRFYGYSLHNVSKFGAEAYVRPNRDKNSSQVDAVQMGYVPGSIIRVNMLQKVMDEYPKLTEMQDDLVKFSAVMSLAFWSQGDGNRVHLNPNATYVTTEEYVNDIPHYELPIKKLVEKFERETI